MDVSKFARRFYSNSLPSGNAKLGDFSVFNNNLYFFNGSQWLLIANSGSSLPLGGDLSGTTTNAEVIGIAGIPVSPTPPLVGEALIFDGLEYIPTPISDPPVGGYLSGTASNATVIGIQGVSVSNTAPVLGEALIFDGNEYSPLP